MLGQQFRQMVFEDGNAALTKCLDLGFVIVDASDVVTHFRKANGRNESHVSRPDNTN
jgi:hypothetical protein